MRRRNLDRVPEAADASNWSSPRVGPRIKYDALPFRYNGEDGIEIMLVTSRRSVWPESDQRGVRWFSKDEAIMAVSYKGLSPPHRLHMSGLKIGVPRAPTTIERH